MKKTIKISALCLAIIMNSAIAGPVFATGLSSRESAMSFQARIADENGLPFDGTVEVQARFYDSADTQVANLIYAEQFEDVEVERGMFRVPLLKGMPIEGTTFDASVFAQKNEVYVDIAVDGTTMLAAQPLGSQIAAMRAEVATVADTLTQPLNFSDGDIPGHSAQNITSGELALSAVPNLNQSKITGGTFSTDQIPDLSTSILDCSSSKFPEAVVPSGLDAVKFTSGEISEPVIPSEVLRDGDFAFASGVKHHGEAVGIPEGFSRYQCVWLVGLRRIHFDGGQSNFGIDQLAVDTDSDGVVFCRWDLDEGATLRWECDVNYLTICKK